MVKVGHEYAPLKAKIVRGGKYTQFTIVQQHRIIDKYWKDGFLNVLVNGEYTFHEGDAILIKKINAANIVSYNGKQYFSIYAEIEYKTMYMQRAGENLQILEDDIPDELL